MTKYQVAGTRRLQRGEERGLSYVKMLSSVYVTARERKPPAAGVPKDFKQGLNMAGVHFSFFFKSCNS